MLISTITIEVRHNGINVSSASDDLSYEDFYIGYDVHEALNAHMVKHWYEDEFNND